MWKEHIDTICSKVNKRLGLLSRIRSCLTLKAANCAYRSVMEPVFNYTDTAWGTISIGRSKNLQKLQNRATHIILRRDSSRDTFGILKWADLEINPKIHKSVFVFKCLHNLVPEYLSNYFTSNSCFHTHNTRRKLDIHLPKPKLSFGKRTFRFSGSVFFNSLPTHFKGTLSLSSFKSLGRCDFEKI